MFRTYEIHFLFYKKVFQPWTETFLAFSLFQYHNFLKLSLQRLSIRMFCAWTLMEVLIVEEKEEEPT